jgi:cytochrome P450
VPVSTSMHSSIHARHARERPSKSSMLSIAGEGVALDGRGAFSAAMPQGLVTVDADQRQRQRRTLAPLFGRKMMSGFNSVIDRVALAIA